MSQRISIDGYLGQLRTIQDEYVPKGAAHKDSPAAQTSYPQPHAGFISAKCARPDKHGKMQHCTCYSLRCTCPCHERLMK